MGGCSLRHIFFAVCWKCADEGACCVRFRAGRRGHMKLHTTLSADLNPTALLFKKAFHLHLVFHNACLKSCASSCRRTGEYLVFIVELPFFCNVYFVAALRLRGKC